MSSGYRGILRYDQVIRLIADSTSTEGILLPPFPVFSNFEDLRLIKPGTDWIWVDLWSLITVWVEFHNGAFILHAIDIPEVNTQSLQMNPDEAFRLAILNGVIYLKNNIELKDDAFVSKVSALKALANSYVDNVRSIWGTFVGAYDVQIAYLQDVGTAYNTHLITLLSFTTYKEIQAYNIDTGWPLT